MIDTTELTDPAGAAALGDSRARVLEILRRASEPVGVRQVAEETGLHLNPARFHLDGLVDAGLAERRSEERLQPGRPRAVYSAVSAEVAGGPRSYRLLAEILTTVLSDAVPEPENVARAAGRMWGSYLTERPKPFERTEATVALDNVVGMLAEMGFDPEVEQDVASGLPRLNLRHCPFREVAEGHRNVVCSVHLGLMQGAFAEMRAPLAVEDLEPFVEPSLCIARLIEASGEADPAA
jgi:predicted ArsR family transcriptional regulator